MKIPDWELWACAAQVQRSHGGEARAFIAKNVGALARSGDTAGVATWRAIAERLDRLGDSYVTLQ